MAMGYKEGSKGWDESERKRGLEKEEGGGDSGIEYGSGRFDDKDVCRRK
jgi:hypothetical protein